MTEFKAPTNEEFQKMTQEQQSKTLNDAIDAVRSTYIEEPLKTEDLLLTKIQSAIESKGFNFYPHALCKAIDAEAERQFQEMIKDIIKGVPPLRLNEMKNSIITWYNEEEVRFETYKNGFMDFARPPVMAETLPTFVHSEEVKSEPIATITPEPEETKVIPLKKKGEKNATRKKER